MFSSAENQSLLLLRNMFAGESFLLGGIFFREKIKRKECGLALKSVFLGLSYCGAIEL